MEFSQWLQEQLTERGWNVGDLVNSAKARGYTLNINQVYRILNRDTQGGVNTVIAIAHGLRLPRKEVFIARGWLSAEIDTNDLSASDPDVLVFLQRVLYLPAHIRQPLLAATNAMLEALEASQAENVHRSESSTSVPGEGDLITVEEAARQTGYAVRTIQKRLQEGKIVGQRRGHQWFTTVDAVFGYKQSARSGRPSKTV